ncbi:MAG TPA: polymorphic toxin type 4 domain-containing protein, partial [Armatimonadota bacterium]|nr:polymorphic toxin type 4 domain-containing protein [Armatimonadota bacterium]
GDKGMSKKKRRKSLEKLKAQYRLASIDLITDSSDKAGEKVHVRAVINPTYDGDGFVIDPAFPPGEVVRVDAIVKAPLTVRPGNERKVLESPGKAGLPGHQRAHLLGPGMGYDLPQGILYAPTEVNQKLQNSGIEHLIRAMYAQRYPGAEFRVVITGTPHTGTEILATVKYVLHGRFPNEDWTQILDVTIKAGLGVAATSKVRAGEIDMDAVHRFSAGAAAVLTTRGQAD